MADIVKISKVQLWIFWSQLSGWKLVVLLICIKEYNGLCMIGMDKCTRWIAYSMGSVGFALFVDGRYLNFAQ